MTRCYLRYPIQRDDEEEAEESVDMVRAASSVLLSLLLAGCSLADVDSESDSELELEDSEDVSSRFRF